MRISRAVAGAAAGLVVLLSACSGSAPKSGPASQSSPAGYTQLTVAQAYSAFTQFLPQFNDLPAHPADIGRLTTGPEVRVVTASRGSAGPTVGDVTDTRILVPELTGYPRWFVAAGSKSSSGEGVLFVLVQRSAGARWQETAELYDLGGNAQIVHDLSAAGFGATATTKAVPGQDASLAMQPAQLPAAYAQYLNDKGAGTQHSAFKAGSYTTGLVSLEQSAAAGATRDGWKYTDTQTSAGLPQYALSLPSGKGAIVIFFTTDTVSWTASSARARMPTAAYSGLARPPLGILQALGISSPRAGLRVSVRAMDENLAIVGAAGTTGVTITANAGRTFSLSRS